MLRNYNRTEKSINENFFDKKSEKMYYVIGTFYSCYYTSKGYRERDEIIFKSRHKKLVELVKEEIFPNHTITSDTREGKSSHWIVVASPQKMHSKLKELGLNVLKDKREFPENIPKNHLYNVVRGFLDAETTTNYKKNRIRIGFYNRFLLGLHKTLVKYARVKGCVLKDKELIYKQNDAMKIYNFIYQNFDFIKKHCLYLREKKDAFYKFITKKPKVNHENLRRRMEKIKRVENAKKLLEEGLSVKEIAKKVKYAHPTRFCSAFREVTGDTPTEYKRDVEEKKEEERVARWL